MVRNHILVARVSRQGKHRRLMSTWTGTCRAANDDKQHVCEVQHFVTAELRDVHVAVMRFHADDQLEITGELLKIFYQLDSNDEHHIQSISAIKGLQAATSALSRWPGKHLKRHRAPGSRCRACSITRRPCCVKR